MYNPVLNIKRFLYTPIIRKYIMTIAGLEPWHKKPIRLAVSDSCETKWAIQSYNYNILTTIIQISFNIFVVMFCKSLVHGRGAKSYRIFFLWPNPIEIT